MPANTEYGLSRSQKFPVNSWLESIGKPWSRSARAIPSSSGASRLPAAWSQPQFRFHAAPSRLPRNSNETPRTISATKSNTIARYRAENIVAYQDGNAAKIPAPATISHTSLPSQTGPIVALATRCSSSVLPITRCNIPTPKSNPSSTKNPVHNTAMAMNQKTWRPMSAAPQYAIAASVRSCSSASPGGPSSFRA